MKSLIEGSDYFVHLADFPTCNIGGAVIPNDDGTYSVYLNSRLSRAQQLRALLHELRHIKNDDFNNHLEISEIEK